MGNSQKAWYVVALAAVFSNPILFVALSIIFAAVFITIYATLVFYGLVSALIYGAVGMLLVFLMGDYQDYL